MSSHFTSPRAPGTLGIALALCLGLVCAAPAAFPSPQTAATAASASASSAQSNTPAIKKKRRTRRHHSSRQPYQKAPTPDRISEIQSVLSRDGYYQGSPNGKWDSSTVAALQKFQSSQGLDPTGKLDALSLQKLGLGSDVAGVSAPKEAAPPSTAAPADHTPKPQPQTEPASTPQLPQSQPQSHPAQPLPQSKPAPPPTKPETPPQPTPQQKLLL
jgi:hypothetical protein